VEVVKQLSRVPTRRTHRDSCLWVHNNLGLLLQKGGNDFEAGIIQKRRALSYEKLAADFRAQPSYQDHIAGSRTTFALR